MDKHILLNSAPDNIQRTSPGENGCDKPDEGAMLTKCSHNPYIERDIDDIEKSNGQLGDVHELAEPAGKITVPDQ